MGAEKEYRRLPGVGRGMVRHTRLYLGRDHLLLVESAGYSEDYKRFYFQDIQAFVCRRTRRRSWWSAVLTIPIALGAAAIFASSEGALRVMWAVLGSPFVVALLVNLLRGPTCVTHVHTPVQIVKLASLGRLRRARKVIGRLQVVIESVQGAVDPAVLKAGTAASHESLATPIG
ncbi:MAG: hypothetical protein AB1714_09445 [Acidobacteriota bacterium]